MMKQMRENTKIILWVVVVAFVITIFAVWGLDLQTGGPAGQNLVGRVNGVPITPQTYQRVYSQLMDQVRASSGDNELTSVQQEMLHDQAWQSIVSNIITDEEIRKLGITVSDEEILNIIRTSPPAEVQQYFLDKDGKFDYAAYQAALNNPGADWTGVEAMVRQRIPVIKLNQYLMAQVHVSPSEVRRAFEEESAKMVARYVSFPIDGEDVGGWAPSDEDVAAWYNAHQDRYQQPEKAVLQVVRVPRVPSERDRSDLAYTARVVRKQATEGEEFTELAKTYSEAHTSPVGGETGFLGTGQRADAVMEAASQLKPGEISQPVITPDGVYLIQLIGARKEKGEQQYNFREIFMKLTAGPETTDSLSAVARDVKDAALPKGDLGAAANAHGLEVTTTQPFAAGMPIPGLGFSPAVSRFAFAGEVGAIGEVISDDNNFYVCRIESRAPASASPLADVSDAIKQALIHDRKVAAAMLKAGAFRRSAVLPGTPFEKAAAQYDYAVANTDSFSVSTPVADMGPYSAFARAALATEPGAVSVPVESGGAIYVIRVDGRLVPGDAAYQEQAPQIRARLFQSKVQTYVAYWYEKLRKGSTIEDLRAVS